jgi:hypothetical protein
MLNEKQKRKIANNFTYSEGRLDFKSQNYEKARKSLLLILKQCPPIRKLKAIWMLVFILVFRKK